MRDGVVHLVFGVLWQIIKQGLLSKVNVTEHPELLDLGLDAAELERLGAHPEELLLRWCVARRLLCVFVWSQVRRCTGVRVNFHLRNAGCERVMQNFTGDVQDRSKHQCARARVCVCVCVCVCVFLIDSVRRTWR